MEFKHGDKIVAINGHQRYECHIEERFVAQSPSKKKALYVCFDTFPRSPIQLDSYLKYFGTIQSIENQQQNKP